MAVFRRRQQGETRHARLSLRTAHDAMERSCSHAPADGRVCVCALASSGSLRYGVDAELPSVPITPHMSKHANPLRGLRVGVSANKNIIMTE